MLNIYIARHGQDIDNSNGILNGHRDEPLTEIGIRQAHEIANMIKSAGLSFNEIFSSPLKRAYDTAKIISSTIIGPEPIIAEELIERDFGVMTGVNISKIGQICAPDIIKTGSITYFLSPEGAETFPDTLVRAEQLLTKIKNSYQAGNILLVTHGDIGKMIYAKYYNLPWQDALTLFHLGNSELILLSEASDPNSAHIFSIAQHNV